MDPNAAWFAVMCLSAALAVIFIGDISDDNY